MSALDEKLESIRFEIKVNQNSHGQYDTLEEHLSPGTIEQVKQAFKDSGYTQTGTQEGITRMTNITSDSQDELKRIIAFKLKDHHMPPSIYDIGSDCGNIDHCTEEITQYIQSNYLNRAEVERAISEAFNPCAFAASDDLHCGAYKVQPRVKAMIESELRQALGLDTKKKGTEV